MPRRANPTRGPGISNGAPVVRPDLPGQPNGRPNQPVTVPTGLPYGQASQMSQGEQSAPLPNGDAMFAHALEQARTQVPAGQPQLSGVTPMDAPTERPNEHIMTGALQPQGIGAQHPMLGGGGAGAPDVPAGAQSGIAQLLSSMADATGSSKLQHLAQAAAVPS